MKISTHHSLIKTSLVPPQHPVIFQEECHDKNVDKQGLFEMFEGSNYSRVTMTSARGTSPKYVMQNRIISIKRPQYFEYLNALHCTGQMSYYRELPMLV